MLGFLHSLWPPRSTALLLAETLSKKSRNSKDWLFFFPCFFFPFSIFVPIKQKYWIVWWRKHILLAFLHVPGCALLSAGRIT